MTTSTPRTPGRPARRSPPRGRPALLTLTLTLALVLAASACDEPAPSDAPLGTPTTLSTVFTGRAGPSLSTSHAASSLSSGRAGSAPSTGNAILFHLQLATGIDRKGNPVGQDTRFPVGTKTILGLLGWGRVPAGTELRLRLFAGDRFVAELSHTVVNEERIADDNVGFVYPFSVAAGFSAGNYAMAVDYDGGLEEIVPFTVGDVPQQDEVVGTASQSGPIPYADPADVLVVTRFTVLRAKLGSGADAVLAAAARVGDLHDLDADGVARATPTAAASEVQRLLAKRRYKYLLIVGNDDAVPYFHIKNPLESDEIEELADWQLPADWVPTDNMYTDLDNDPFQVPDIPIARIPSSDDRQLLLTQLGENVPPDGGAYALLNQERRSLSGLVIGMMSDVVQVRLKYAPPIDPQAFASSPDAAAARYLYVLLHGIGVETNAWSTDTVIWRPLNSEQPYSDEWLATASEQIEAVTVETNPTGRGVIFVGACYGGWTLDTIQEPVHKTADNNLALHYLKGGARAFVADDHLSYTVLMAAGDIPAGRTGFELLYWAGLRDGLSPIDAFQRAKVQLGATIAALVQAGDVDTAGINYKTLHYMVYLGRP